MDKPIPTIIDVQRQALGILNRMYHGHIYAGTADPTKVAKRRAKNRVARKSRRRNRKAGR